MGFASLPPASWSFRGRFRHGFKPEGGIPSTMPASWHPLPPVLALPFRVAGFRGGTAPAVLLDGLAVPCTPKHVLDHRMIAEISSNSPSPFPSSLPPCRCKHQNFSPAMASSISVPNPLLSFPRPPPCHANAAITNAVPYFDKVLHDLECRLL